MTKQPRARKKTLKSRLTMLIVWFCMIQVLMVAGGYLLTIGNLTTRANERIENITGTVYDYVREIADYADNLSESASVYVDYGRMVGDDEAADEQLKRLQMLLRLSLSEPKVVGACALLPEEKVLVDADSGVVYSSALVERNDSYRIYSENGGQNIRDGFYYFFRSDTNRQFVYLKKMRTSDTAPRGIYLLLRLEEDKFMSLVNGRNSVAGEVVVLMSEDGVLRSTSPLGDDVTELARWFASTDRSRTTLRINGTPYLTAAGNRSAMGITPVYLVPRSAHYEELYRFLIIMGTNLVLNLMIWIYFARSLVLKMVYGPVMELVTNLERVRNNDYEIIRREFDEQEWDEVTEIFNMMVRRIEANTRETYQKDLLMKNMELKFLQSQINPHFLYNTLDSIAYMANDGQIEDVNRIISCLSRMYRLVFNKGRDFLSVGEVLQCCEMFLEICRYRYDNFDYRIECDEDIRDINILNLIVQTICENAVVHGYDASSGQFMITVKGHRSGDVLTFEVHDNGNGISADRVEVFNRLLRRPESGSDSGLANAARRIRLYYGEEYGITLESVQGSYTRVTVTMPVTRQAEELPPDIDGDDAEDEEEPDEE